MKPSLRLRPSTVAGFTLIEVVVSTALMSLIVASAYVCLNAALASQKQVEPRAEIIQQARVALGLLAADLRHACVLSRDYPFVGLHRMLDAVEADNLDFASHNYSPRRLREGDFCELSVYVDKDPATGECSLWRRRNPRLALDSLAGGGREQLARGVLGLRFEFFDGFEWRHTWGDSPRPGGATGGKRSEELLPPLPEAVRISLLLDPSLAGKASRTAEGTPAAPPLAFQTVALLNLAASAELGASSAAGSADGSSGAGTENPPGGGLNSPGGVPR